MTAPNYGGWTDARAGMRWQETLAKSIAHELKEQMDDFLNAAGEAIDQPLEALHRELNSSSLTLSDAVALVYAQHELKPEGEQDAAGIAEIDEWLGESPSLHDIAIKSAEYNVRRAHETGMNIEWAENRLREERIKATRRAAA